MSQLRKDNKRLESQLDVEKSRNKVLQADLNECQEKNKRRLDEIQRLKDRIYS